MRKLLMLLLFFTTVLLSCTSLEDMTYPNQLEFKEDTSSNNYLYFIDEQIVSKGVFDTRDKRIPFTSVYVEDSVVGKIFLELHSFSSEEKFFEFGDKHDYCFRAMNEFGKEVSSFAETQGIIEEYERTGNVPDYYHDFERRKYEELVQKCAKLKINEVESRVTTLLFDLCVGGGASPMPNTLPFMPFLNNRVSSFEFVAFTGGFITMWDRSFFRDLIYSRSLLGLDRECLPREVDNRMSSGITGSF